MRLARFPALLIGALLFVAGSRSAGADDSPVWLVPGGGVAWVPAELRVDESRPHVGGILGFRLSPAWALEGRGSYMKVPSTIGRPDLHLPHAEGNLTWFTSAGSFSPYLTAGAGVAYFRYSGADGGQKRFDYGGGGGFRARLSDQIALRADARLLRYKAVDSLTGEDEVRNHAEVFGGLSFDFGGTPKDTDRDGVPDKSDRCPGTPAGARVDARGCPGDSDGDGVYDGLDGCEATPSGAVVDAKGCPMDADSDRVADGIDRCPDTPVGATVDPSGCPSDDDQDAVYDGLDRCPGTAKGCVVNSNGCPIDTDQDGVCDGLDRCPDTPPTAKADRQGCPLFASEKETELIETGMIRLQNVNFETGKANLLPESERVLQEVGTILGRWPQLRIEVAGHTDSRGSASANLSLSRSRAQAVRRYLIQRFPELDPAQFTAAGYGSSRPIADNRKELGRAQNRRVEFRVLNKEALRREKESQKLVPRE